LTARRWFRNALLSFCAFNVIDRAESKRRSTYRNSSLFHRQFFFVFEIKKVEYKMRIILLKEKTIPSYLSKMSSCYKEIKRHPHCLWMMMKVLRFLGLALRINYIKKWK
jgi:hypothetical protein